MSELWDAVSSWYRRDEVAAACGALQDDHGVDVLVLLACAWAGFSRGNSDPALHQECLAETVGWRDGVVDPLRRIRRSIPPGPSSETRVREAVSDAEVAAERLQLDRLERLITRSPHAAESSDPSSSLVAQLTAVGRHVEVHDRSALPLLAVIGAAIDPGRTSADIESALMAASPQVGTATTGASRRDTMTVRCLQVDSPSDEPLDERVDRIAALLDHELEHQSTNLVVLPELWTTGFFHFDRYRIEAQSIDGSVSQRLSSIAERHSVWLFGGSFVELASDGRCYNTSVAFAPNGELVGRYRKVHLFGYESAEASTLAAGAEPVVVATPFGRVGMATCYDLRFPELFRAMVDAGAEVFVVVSAWPASRRDHWELLARARAVENLTWLVACNATGDQAGTALAGTSLIVSPWGKVVERAGTDPQTIGASLSLAFLHQLRAEFPSLTDRRQLPSALVQGT